VGPRDGQGALRTFLGLEPLTQEFGCDPLGTQVLASGVAHPFGDWDCDGAVGPRDGQAILVVFLGKPPLSQTQPCPPINKQVPVFTVR
jgi:hypothetical protein